MKRFIRLFTFVAVLAAFIVACEKEQEVVSVPTDGIEINIIADGSALSSKTAAVGGTNPSVKWTSSDVLTVYEIVADTVYQTTTTTSVTLSDNDYVANFKANLTGSPNASSYKYAAVYPSVAVDQGGSGENKFYRLKMPNTQHLIGNNFSSDSDVMISEVIDNGDTRVSSTDNLAFSFKRVGTAVQLTLKGITTNEKIKSVTLTAPQNIAGYVKYVRETSSLDPESWYYANAQKTITLTVDDLTATGSDTLWFRVLAKDAWVAGDSLSIAVETDAASYFRNGRDASHKSIALGKEIKFVDGGLTAFGVNMASYRVAKENGTVYTKVTSNDEIGEGASYLVANLASASATSATVMGPITGSYAGQVADIAVDTANDAITIYHQNQTVQIVTFESTGTINEFYVKFGDQYLYLSAASNNKMALSSSKLTGDNLGKDIWTVTTDGIVNTVVKNNDSNVYYSIQYNGVNSRFSNYASAQGAITLFKNGDVTGVAPRLDAPTNVSASVVNGDDIQITWTDITVPDGETVTYSVTCTGKSAQTVAQGVHTYTFEDLADGTYSVSVTAIPGTTAHRSSMAVTVNNLVVETNPSTASYVKVTSALSDWNGKYLIVYESGSLAFDGSLTTLDAVNNTRSVVISNNKIASTTVTDSLAFTVASVTNGYTIKSFSGYYIGQNSDANALSSSTSIAYTNTITDGSTITSSGGAYLRYNSNSGQERFRYFKSSTYSSQQAIQLYKLTSDSGSGSGSDPGTESNPYSASAAYEAATSTPQSDVYVKGIVSAITTAWSSNKVTYKLSDNGSTEGNQFQIYQGAAASADVVAVGDGVIVKGSLVKYNNATPQLSAGAVIQSSLRMPAFASGDENFTTSTSVTLSAASGATIHYTTDGTAPTTESTTYSAAIPVSATTTIKAIAVKDGLVTGVASKTFTKVSTYALTWSAPSHGSLVVKQGETTISSNAQVPAGATINITASPEDGYTLSTLVYNDGSDHDIKSAMSFTMPSHAVSITATFTESSGNPTSVSYDFTGTDWSVSDGTLTNGTVSFSGAGGDKFQMNSGYFIMGKSGAYLTFPTYSYPVTKIEITGNTGASGSVVQNIYVGDTAVSTATTGATEKNTYSINSNYQSAGTTYVLKVTSKHNTQITKIEVFF